MHRALDAWHLTLLGIGAVIGAGIFVLTGHAAASCAGPAISLSFVLCGVQMAALPRDPESVKIEDLLRVKLVVALNRIEHETLLRNRFGRIPVELEKLGRLRYWNVFDIPIRSGWTRILQWNDNTGTQPETSGGEHIHFAVQALVGELARKGR